MRKLPATILVVLACALVTTAMFGQTNPPPPTAQNPATLSNPTMSQQLQSDLSTRNTQLGNQSVSWFDNGNGYYGTYSIGSETYMANYDKQGNYVGTMTKGDWNDSTVPPPLKSSFDQTRYKDQQVTGYWESSDPADKKGYYMEVQDNNGKTSRVWADENGKFSNNPPKMRTDTSKSKNK